MSFNNHNKNQLNEEIVPDNSRLLTQLSDRDWKRDRKKKS